MLDEHELLELIERGLSLYDEDGRLRDVEFKRLPTDNAATLVVTVDGAEFVVCVTQVKEAD